MEGCPAPLFVAIKADVWFVRTETLFAIVIGRNTGFVGRDDAWVLGMKTAWLLVLLTMTTGWPADLILFK